MVEIEGMNIGGVKLRDCVATTSSTLIVELREQLESRDSRLSVVESSVREVQNSMQIWSDIIRDGLADLNMQMKAATQGPRVRPKHVESASEDDFNVFERLSKVEQRMQTMQTMAQEDCELNARIVSFEKRMQALQGNMTEMQDQCFRVLQDSFDKLNERLNVLTEKGPILGRSDSLQNLHECCRSMQRHVGISKGGALDSFRLRRTPSPSPSPLWRPQRVQQLHEHSPPHKQFQGLHEPRGFSACVPPPRARDNSDEQLATAQLVKEQSWTNHVQPRSGITEIAPVKFRWPTANPNPVHVMNNQGRPSNWPDMTQAMATMLSPRQHHRSPRCDGSPQRTCDTVQVCCAQLPKRQVICSTP